MFGKGNATQLDILEKAWVYWKMHTEKGDHVKSRIRRSWTPQKWRCEEYLLLPAPRRKHAHLSSNGGTYRHYSNHF